MQLQGKVAQHARHPNGRFVHYLADYRVDSQYDLSSGRFDRSSEHSSLE